MQLDKLLDKGEPDARTLVGAAVGSGHPMEALEDLR